ncbi:hypothetical protein CRUP_037834 [Coryphaenoides rupestris]|nr:hypothetical protein CRUP_037834 [Coryphaenoides rupestris]
MAGTTGVMLSLQPTRGLVDEELRLLRVQNLSPAAPVTLRCLHRSEHQNDWEAFGHYTSDHQGTVNVLEDESFGGTLRKKHVDTPMVMVISVYGGHLVAGGFGGLPPLASVVVERWYMAPGVKRVEVAERGVTGTFFIPAGPGPYPGVLDMWGGGGGLVEYRAALLASHGFAAMALKYMDHGNHDITNINIGYLETAFQIIQDHPQVISDRVGILGLSFGTTLALMVAAYSKVVKPCCCVCISGSHVIGTLDIGDMFLEMVR